MNNIKIGVSNHNTEWKRYFDGIVDEVRIWNVARTQTQIQDNVNKTLVGNEANLVAYYRMDYLTAGGNNTVAPNNFTTLYDITANGNDGTLTNFARTGATSNYIASTAFNTWIGGESTSWATAGNWSRNAAPVSADNVGIYSSGNNANLNSTVTVDNLVVATGATLNLGGSANLTVSEMDFVNGTVNRSSGTVSEETRSISGTGTQTYGLADATVDVQTLGSLSSLQVERTESAHSQENHAGGAAKIVDRYLTLTPNASPGSFSVELCFNYTDAEVPGLTESSLRLCRWTGSAWTCPSRGTNSNTTTNKVCADSITTFSDWVMGEVGPTAVTLRRFAAGLAGGVNGFVLPLALVALGAVGLLVWRRQKRRKTYVEET